MKLEGPGESDKIKKLPRVKAWKRVGVGACRLLENSTVCLIVNANCPAWAHGVHLRCVLCVRVETSYLV